MPMNWKSLTGTVGKPGCQNTTGNREIQRGYKFEVGTTVSEGHDNIVPGHTLVLSYGAKDCVERANSKSFVVRDHDSLAGGFVCLQNPVVTNLVYLVVSPVSA